MQVKPLRTYYLTAGLAFKLECNNFQTQNRNVSVTWSYNQDQKLENISGISVKHDALWFLPARPFHRGNYSCLSRCAWTSYSTKWMFIQPTEICPVHWLSIGFYIVQHIKFIECKEKSDFIAFKSWIQACFSRLVCDRQGKESWVTMFNITVDEASCPRMNRENTAQTTIELTCMLEHIFQVDPQAHVTWMKVRHPLVRCSCGYILLFALLELIAHFSLSAEL